MSWRPPHRTRNSRGQNRTYADIFTHGGCLRITCKGTATITSNRWEYLTTWAALGAPAWAVVTAASAGYQYRWDTGMNFGGLTSGNSTGPFEFRSDAGALIGATSSAVSLTNAFGGSTGKESHNPFVSVATGHQAPGVNRNWATETGIPILVPANLRRPDSTILLRLNSSHQAVPAGNHTYLRLRQDNIILTVTYKRRHVATV